MSLVITDVRCSCGVKLCERIEFYGKGRIVFTCRKCHQVVKFEEGMPTSGKPTK